MSSRKGFVHSAKLISILTLASRVLGLIRDTLCGSVFGAGWVMSAFSVGFQIPNLFRRLFGEGALSASSIPVLTDALHHGGKEAVDRLAGKLMGVLLTVLITLTIISELVALGLWPFLGHSQRDQLTFSLTTAMLPYMIPICAAAILSGIQNIFGQFGVPAMNPIVLNGFMISGLLIGRYGYPGNNIAQVWVLTASVLVSGVFQLAWQWHNARGCGLRIRPKLDWHDPALIQIGRTMIPMTLGLGVVQLNTFVDSMLAYVLIRSHEGGPAVLYFAQRLYQFPLGVFAIAMATAIFPTMSMHATIGEKAALIDTYRRGLRVVLFEGLPCTIGLIMIRYPLIETLFQHGEFGPDDTVRVARTLVAFSAGIWAFGVNQIQVRAFYAVKDAKTPLKIATWMVVLNVIGNVILVLWLEEAGLALSTTICAALQVVWLSRRLTTHLGGPVGIQSLIGPIVRMIIATALMAVCILAIDAALKQWAPYANRASIRLFIQTGCGGMAYLLAAWALRCTELRMIFGNKRS